MRPSLIISAMIAALVGFGSTLALLIAAANALGATQAQTASWVTAICIAKAFETMWLSWRYKMPIVTAWSTAGLALIGASIGFNMSEAVGAFILAAILLMLTGLFRPLTELVSKIPTSISAGMLAGILLPFILAAAKSAQLDPLFVLPLIGVFLLLRLKNSPMAILSVLLVGAIAAIVTERIDDLPHLETSTLVFVAPEFTIAGLFGLAIPLYLVTMASQNLPGIAVLRASGYDNPPTGQIITITGLFSFLSAVFCASTTNLAAITAAICTGEDAHYDKTKRWLTAPYYALCYAIFALFGASLVAVFSALPVSLITLIAGLALLGPLTNATSIALEEPAQRVAAVTTLAVTASGISFFGVGAAFWGLAVGLLMVGLAHLYKGIEK